jgi:hypothetical protein
MIRPQPARPAHLPCVDGADVTSISSATTRAGTSTVSTTSATRGAVTTRPGKYRTIA